MKKPEKQLSKRRIHEISTAYIFILPMLAGLMLFSVIPFVQNILYSFRKMGTFGNLSLIHI